MGEYAKYEGQEVKIGTCENMYYLRYSQARRVQRMSGNVDPVADREELRFRFPWPDEDAVAPGAFENYERAVGVNVTAPDVVDHHSVQFTASAGYNVCLPCPEGKAARDSGLKIHRNGHRGIGLISQQRWVAGQLVLIMRCGGCGTAWRASTLAEATPVIDACLAEAKSHDWSDRERNYAGPSSEVPPSSAGDFWREVAKRIALGYEGKAF